MPSPNLSRAAAELEGLPSDGGKTVDALAGGLLRTFVRIGELETDLALVNRRLAVLEGADTVSAAKLDISRTQKMQPVFGPRKGSLSV
jgi:hypothetical protein